METIVLSALSAAVETMQKVCYLTWPSGPCQVKESKIILDQSLPTGWLAMWIVNLVSNIHNKRWAEPWNEVQTSCHKWSAEATLNQVLQRGKIPLNTNYTCWHKITLVRVNG